VRAFGSGFSRFCVTERALGVTTWRFNIAQHVLSAASFAKLKDVCHVVRHRVLTTSLVEHPSSFQVGNLRGGIPKAKEHFAVVFPETGSL
jgi:hypothetical protein